MPQHHDCRKQAISLRTKIVGVNAMLQQLLPDIRMLTMPLRKWPLILFALPFVLVAPHHCIAGPLHRSICRDSCVGELRDDPFPTATVHRQRPTSISRFEKVIDLRRITPPTGFRVRDPNNANPNGLSLLARPWPPPYPATAVGLGGGGCFFVCSTIEVGVDAGRVLNDVRDAVGSAVEKVLTQPVSQ
jgi:hypothetical protein